MRIFHRIAFAVFLSLTVLSASIIGPFPAFVATAEAGIIKKSVAAYLSSRLVKAMFINGSRILRDKAKDQFFAVVKGDPSLAPKAARMIESFAKSPKFAQHLKGPRGEEMASELKTAVVRLKAWNKPSLAPDHPLRGTMDNLYRMPSNMARIGSGNSADALRYERLTGQLVGGKGHAQKVSESITSIRNWLSKPGNDKLGHLESDAIRNVLDDLMDAARP